MTCKTHGTPLRRRVLTDMSLYCPTCEGIPVLPDVPDREPDYDLAGKYDRPTDYHATDYTATAQVGWGWWKGG